MNQVTVGSYLAQRLEEVGILDYFAIPGDFNLSLLDELLKNPRLKMINCCNELNAGYAADGSAREKGVAALVLTFGVGGLSAVNAVAGAYAEDLPVIVVSGGPNVNSLVENRVLHHTLALPEDGDRFVLAIYKEITAHAVVIREATTAAYRIDDSWFNGMDLQLPDGCGFEIQMQYGSIGWSVGAFLGLAVSNKSLLGCGTAVADYNKGKDKAAV
jgi:indolepyruvate decarboxylase